MIRVMYCFNIFVLLFLLFCFGCQQSSDNQNDTNKEYSVSSDSASFSEVSDSLVIVLLKKERSLEFWNLSRDNSIQLISRQQIAGRPLATGPRLSDHSLKLPEGVYQFDSAHRLIFPNTFDQNKAIADKRTLKNKRYELTDLTLFQPIFEAVKRVGSSKSSIIIVPTDLRTQNNVPACVFCPVWTNELYNNLRFVLEDYQID